MAGPGTGRYTTYVPVASSRNTLLRNLFNSRADNGAGVFYGTPDQTNNIEAAKEAVKRATDKVTAGVGGLLPSEANQAGDAGMFPEGVDLKFGGAPNLAEVSWASAGGRGGPANPYTPDLSSPGPGKTEGVQKEIAPAGITVADVKGAAYVPGAPNTGTTSPSATSGDIGSVRLGTLGTPLKMGKSSV